MKKLLDLIYRRLAHILGYGNLTPEDVARYERTLSYVLIHLDAIAHDQRIDPMSAALYAHRVHENAREIIVEPIRQRKENKS